MKMEPLASAQLAALSLEADQPLAVPRTALRLPSPIRKNPEMLQSHCLQKRSPLGKSERGESRHPLQMKTTPAVQMKTTSCPPRMLRAMTKTDISTTRIGGDGRRMLSTPRQGTGGGDDPEEPPGGGGGGAGQGDRGGQPPPPPRGDGDQPCGQHRQAGIIDGDVQGAAIVEVLSVLAKRFEKKSRPPPPLIPTFKDSYKDYPRFRADLQAYLT